MKIKVTCSKNPNHRQFSVSAHIAQDWLVDEHADFLKVLEEATETVHRPDAGDLYTCNICGTQAKAELVRS